MGYASSVIGGEQKQPHADSEAFRSDLLIPLLNLNF